MSEKLSAPLTDFKGSRVKAFSPTAGDWVEAKIIGVDLQTESLEVKHGETIELIAAIVDNFVFREPIIGKTNLVIETIAQI